MSAAQNKNQKTPSKKSIQQIQSINQLVESKSQSAINMKTNTVTPQSQKQFTSGDEMGTYENLEDQELAQRIKAPKIAEEDLKLIKAIFDKSLQADQLQEQIQNSLTNIKCPIHYEDRYIDQICALKDCQFSRYIFCSKCIIQDEDHIKLHKDQIQGIEKFLPDVINRASGNEYDQKLKYMIELKYQLQKDIIDKMEKTLQQMDLDFELIEKNVIALLQHMKQNLKTRLRDYIKNFVANLEQIEAKTKDMQNKHSFEQYLIFQSIKEMLDVIDPQKEHQLNNFIKKLKNSNPQFQAKDFIVGYQPELEELMKKVYQMEFFPQEEVNKWKQNIDLAIQQPFQENKLLNFNFKVAEDNIQALPKQENLQYNQASIIIDKNWGSPSLTYKRKFETTHKSPINSIISIENGKYLATSGCSVGNGLIQIWGTQPDYKFYNASYIKLPFLSLAMKYMEHNKILFASGGKNNFIYGISLTDIQAPQIICQFQSESMVRILLIHEEQNLIFSHNSSKIIQVFKLPLQIQEQQQKLISNEVSTKNPFQATYNLLSSYQNQNQQKNPSSLLRKTQKTHIDGLFSIMEKTMSQFDAKNDEDDLLTIEDEFHFQSDSYYKLGDIQKQKQYIAYGNSTKKGYITLFNFFSTEQNEIQLQKSYEFKAHNEQVTALCLSTANQQILYSGSKGGSIGIWNYSKQECLQKIRQVKSLIFGIIIFEKEEQNMSFPSGYIISFEQGNKINVWDIQSTKCFSNTKYTLKNSKDKHINYQGCCISQKNGHTFSLYAIGNDDVNIESYELSFTL